MLKVILAKSYDEARSFLQEAGGQWVAIETEYGHNTIDEKCPGVALSLNHHGELQHEEAPALAYKKNPARYDNFIISHIDLDVLFGILWTAGWLKKTKTTIELSKYVALADTRGFHIAKNMLEEKNPDLKEKYLAIGYLVNSWVINDNGKNIVDISKEVHKLLLRIKDIILDGVTEDQIKSYLKWFSEQEAAAKAHLKEIRPLCGTTSDNLFIFRAPFSLTTAYAIGEVEAQIIVQYNEQSKSISISCFDEQVAQKYFGDRGVIEPLQKFFGRHAGGKKAIGGTPRSQDIQPEMLPAFVDFLYREYFNVPEIEEISGDIKLTDSRLLGKHQEAIMKLYKE